MRTDARADMSEESNDSERVVRHYNMTYYTTCASQVNGRTLERQRAGTHLRSQTNDLPPSLHTEVRAHNTTYPRPEHLTLVVEEHSGVVVETDEAAVRAADGLAGADDDGAADVALADLGRGGGGLASDGAGALDDADDLVADAAPAVVDLLLEDVDALDEECSRVVYDLQEEECVNGGACRTEGVDAH